MIFSSKLTQFLLAGLINVTAPGNSTYSQTPIPLCDKICQESISSKFNQELYDEHYAKLLINNTPELAKEKAKPLSFTRKENYKEGLARYAIIAEGLAIVSQKSTRNICNSECDNISDEERISCNEDILCNEQVDGLNKTCHSDCVTSAPWLWSRKELAYMLLTIVQEESGARSDIHGGTGKFGRGDCQWRLNGFRVSAWSKGAYPVKDTCTSFGISQHRVVKGAKGKVRHFDWIGEQLLGIDLESTKRSLTVAAKDISMAKNYCLRMGRSDRKDIAKLTFGAYGSGNSCIVRQRMNIRVNGKMEKHYAYRMTDGIEWGLVPPDGAISNEPLEILGPAKRSKIFQNHYYYPKKLNKKTLEALEDPDVIKTFEMLRDSNEQLFWMLPVK